MGSTEGKVRPALVGKTEPEAAWNRFPARRLKYEQRAPSAGTEPRKYLLKTPVIPAEVNRSTVSSRPA